MSWFIEEEEQFKGWLDNNLGDDDLKQDILNQVHEHYFDPKDSVAFIYTIGFIRSLARRFPNATKLEDRDCLAILTKLWLQFQQEDLIDLAYDLISEQLGDE